MPPGVGALAWCGAALVVLGGGPGPPSRCPGGFARGWPWWLAWGWSRRAITRARPICQGSRRAAHGGAVGRP